MAVMHWQYQAVAADHHLETFSHQGVELVHEIPAMSAPAAGIMPVFRVSGMVPVVGFADGEPAREAADRLPFVVACHDVIRSVGRRCPVTVMIWAAVGVTIRTFCRRHQGRRAMHLIPYPSTSVDSRCSIPGVPAASAW